MVKIEVVKKRLKQLNISLEKVKRFKGISLEEFLKDDIIQDVVEYNLFIAINMVIDISTHIVVDNKLGHPECFGEAFDILYKEGYLTNEDTKRYKNMIAFRNILSHEYVQIDKKMIYNIMQNNLIDFDRFIIIINDKFL